ncbi:hypothetical protein [Deinococcus metallilatus]|uniref:Uncharacterized protein n=1 Tax=Deinococcus metallilatus TaxID=1211322 RepID=A0ABR6MW63_9DEIO|nr:hypothetical protein [Deinococcus metallilatus]MBB5295212.1 hypothetical protein [Deinococcus metallilatus]
MERDGGISELESLHALWRDFEESVLASGLEPARCRKLLLKASRYREGALIYRLSGTDRLEELKLEIKNSYFKLLRPEWFSELNRDEVIEILPLLVPASLHWEPHGNGGLMNFINVALDALPRDLASRIYLDAFARYLRSFGYYARATPEEKVGMLKEFMCLDRLHIYRSATARENRQALQDLIRDLLGEEAVAVYQAGLDAALAASRG